MGHYCWVCDSLRPNEAFSGKGHKQHVCKKCVKLSEQERERIKALQNMSGFLKQPNISEKNISYLRKQCSFPDEEVQRYAKLVLDVARIKPKKRGRIKYLVKHHRSLLGELEESGLLLPF